MSTLRIDTANFFAKNSCTKWQKTRTVRKICRWIYRKIMETNAKQYPYADSDFANWPESDDKDNYTLITDSCNFVIRHSTSYIAWKIKETTGRWPALPKPGLRAPGEHNFDAKHWDEILNYNGWIRRIHGPNKTDGDKHLVGVIKKYDEFGLVVWFEGLDIGHIPGVNHGNEASRGYVTGWNVSTYLDFKKVHLSFPSTNESSIIWYEEPRNYRHIPKP